MLFKNIIFYRVALFILITIILVLTALLFLNLGPTIVKDLLYRYRLYRIEAAIIIGFVLGYSGACLQSVLRNPLVDHYILGIGSGALFTTYLYTLIFQRIILSEIMFVAVIGGLTTLFMTISIAEAIGGSDIAYVLSGIGISSFFSGLSIILAYMILTINPYALHMLVGSLAYISYKWKIFIEAILIITIISYFFLAKPLNALLLGDEFAMQLGYHPRIYRFTTILISGIVSSIIVACCGLIGFLGLVSPHISRLLTGTSDNRYVIPFSGLISAYILLVSDNFVRLVLVGSVGEIPVGAIVSSFGAPFYLLILVRRLRKGV